MSTDNLMLQPHLLVLFMMKAPPTLAIKQTKVAFVCWVHLSGTHDCVGGVAYMNPGSQWTSFYSIFRSNGAISNGGAFLMDAAKLYLGELPPEQPHLGPGCQKYKFNEATEDFECVQGGPGEHFFLFTG